MGIVRKGERERDDAVREGVLDITFNDMENVLVLPKGYRIRAIYADPYFRSLEVVIEGDDLPPVEEGEQPTKLPALDIVVNTQRLRHNGKDGLWKQVEVRWHKLGEKYEGTD